MCLSHKLRVKGKELFNREIKSVPSAAMREKNWTDVTVNWRRVCCPSGTHKTLLERKGKETESVNHFKI